MFNKATYNFLRHIRDGGTVSGACGLIGISRNELRTIKDNNPALARAIDRIRLFAITQREIKKMTRKGKTAKRPRYSKEYYKVVKMIENLSPSQRKATARAWRKEHSK